MLAEDILSQIEILSVNDLLFHEQTIPDNLKKLKEAMLNIGQLVDPVVVDKKTKLILDGNHRNKVLKIIECPFVTCQVVDYSSDSIKVGTWYPTTDKTVESIFMSSKCKKEEVDFEQGIESIEKSKAAFMISHISKGKTRSYLVSPGSYKLMELIEEQNYVLSSLGESVNFRYIADDTANDSLQKGQTVFFRRSYLKNEIIKASQSHSPFPPKSTRHSIPDRIIRLNMRLGWLHEGIEEAREYLRHMLEKRVYEGNVRRYTEPVIVIY